MPRTHAPVPAAALAALAALGTLAAPGVARAQDSTAATGAPQASPPGGFGALAFDVAVGRGLTLGKGATGLTTTSVAEPLLTRLGAGLSLGGGFWLEGTLRGAMDSGFTAVRSLTTTAGVRIDTDREALLSLSIRLGYDALLAGPVSHGGYVAASVNLRPWRAVVIFAEGCAEAWPGASVERSTANGRSGDSFTVLAVISYLGGIRLSL